MSTSDVVEVPLTGDDMRVLRDYASGGSFAESLGVAAWPTFIVAGLGYLCAKFVLGWFLAPSEADQYLGLSALATTAIALILCRCLWIEAFAKLLPSNGTNHFERDIAGGVAHCLSVNVTRVVEIAEYEDEGAGFLLELSDGRVFALISQDLYGFASDCEYEEGDEDLRHLFPQTRIEYRYAPSSKLNLGCRGIGEPLRPIGKVKTTKHHFVKSGKDGMREFVGAEDGQFYDGSLEEVLKRLQYKLEAFEPG